MLLSRSVLDKRFSSYAQTDGTCSRQVTHSAAVQTQTNTRLASHNQQLTEYYRAVMKFTSAAKKITAEFRFVFAENPHSSTLLSLTALSVGTTRVSRYWETHDQSGFYLRLPSTLGNEYDFSDGRTRANFVTTLRVFDDIDADKIDNNHTEIDRCHFTTVGRPPSLTTEMGDPPRKKNNNCAVPIIIDDSIMQQPETDHWAGKGH